MSEENEPKELNPNEPENRDQTKANGDARRDQEKSDANRQAEELRQAHEKARKEKEQGRNKEDRFVVTKHQTVEAQDAKQHIPTHEVHLPNQKLDFLISQNEDDSLTLHTKEGKAYLVVQDKPSLVKDSKTGRTMVRVLDQSSNERMYDPLSGKLLPKRQEAEITTVAVEVPSSAENYAEELTETLADNIDEDIRVDVSDVPRFQNVSEVDVAEFGGEALIYEIYYKQDDTEFENPRVYLATMEDPEKESTYAIDRKYGLRRLEWAGGAEAPPAQPPPEFVPNDADDSSEQATRDYYRQQIGTIPRPNNVGFRDYIDFNNDYKKETSSEIPYQDRVFRFRQVYDRLYDVQDQQNLNTLRPRAEGNADETRREINALKEFELVVAPLIADGARLSPSDPGPVTRPRRDRQGRLVGGTETVTIPTGFVLHDKDGNPIRRADGTYIAFGTADWDARRFTFNGQEDALAEKKLVIAQYLVLQQDQEKWVDDHLLDAAEVSENDEDLQLRLNAIKSSANSFLNFEIHERYTSTLNLIDAKLRFRKSGIEGLKGRGEDLMTYMPQVLRLPGVAELVAEIERREAHVQWERLENGEYRKYGLAEQKKRRDKMMEEGKTDDDPEGTGAANLTFSRDAKNQFRPTYNKIRRNLLRTVQPAYETWRTGQINDLQTEINGITDIKRIDEKLQKQRDLLQLKKQTDVNDLSFEAAEWWWRMAGRAAKVGDDSVGGQILQYELACFPEWFLKKTRGWNSTYTATFGVTSQEELINDCLPGESKGPNYHPLWYDYVSNYTIFYPGEQAKPAFVIAYADSHDGKITGFKKVSEEVDKHMEELWKKYNHYVTVERDIPGLVSSKVNDELSVEDKKVLDEWNSAPIMELDLKFMREIAKPKSTGVFADWHDYIEKDFADATKLKESMGKFINGPTMKDLSDMKDAFWGRKWKARHFSKSSMETMLNFRTLYARENDMGINWGSENVENALEDAKKAGIINPYDEEELAEERIGKTFNFNVPGRKAPIHFMFHHMPDFMAKGSVKVKKFGPKILTWIMRVFGATFKDFFKKANPTSGGGH